MHWNGSNCIGRGFYEVIRVLTKFQLNLVIRKNNIYGYISTKGGDMYLWGFFNIFLIWGGEKHGIYIIKLEISINL